MADGETIAAIATARGRGGIAVIRISGAGAYEVASKVCGTHVLPGDAGTFKHVFFRDSSGRILDDGLLLVFAITFFSLLTPNGKVLISLGSFNITEGALNSGLFKSGILLILQYFSKIVVSSKIKHLS